MSQSSDNSRTFRVLNLTDDVKAQLVALNVTLTQHENVNYIEVSNVASIADVNDASTTATISAPATVRANFLGLINPPEVELVSAGNDPVIGNIFAATHYAMSFPEVGTGTIEYVDNNGKTKKYTLNKADVWTDDKKLKDGIIKINSISNVTLEDKGLMYEIVEPQDPEFFIPTAMPIKPAKPKFYKIYFGNPVYPQGSIVYFDSKGINKMITNFGKIMTIDVSNIYSLQNVRIEELGDVV
jgi:hypothetical protein